MRALLLIVSLSLCGLCFSAVSTPQYFSTNYHWYQLITPNSPVTYDQAIVLANASTMVNQQAYLVTINDAPEAQFIFNKWFNTATGNGKAYPASWTGAKKTAATGLWFWYATSVGRSSAAFWNQSSSTHTCLNGLYCNWAPSEPSTAGLCMQSHFSASTVAAGYWTAKDCNALSSAFVVEYDPPGTKCPTGYSYTASPYPQCVDTNECLSSTACPTGFTCQNSPGSYTCNDINECLTGNICPSGYSCRNTNGSFACDDINECLSSPCQPVVEKCVNTNGSFSCEDLTWTRIKSNLGDLYLDLEGGATAALTNVVIASFSTSNTQLWKVTADGHIVNKAAGYVVDISNDNIATGTQIIVWPEKPVEASANQVWSFDTTTASPIICNSQSLFVLDVYGGQPVSGQPIILWWGKTADQGLDNQLWTLVPPL